MAPMGEIGTRVREKEARKKYFSVFSHPRRRDGTGCDLNDVNPRAVAAAATLPLVSEELASAPAASDMTQRIMCVSWLCRRCVISLRFLGVLWYCCTVFRRTDVPIGRCTAFSGHVGACLPTIWYVSVHILPYHRGIDPSQRSHRAAYCLQQRCLVKAVCSIYQCSIAPIREMAPGVPCKALNKVI